MVHEVKNIKTKLPRLRIYIDFGVRLTVLAAVIGLLCACGATVSTLLGAYLGYRVSRLVLRLLGLFFAAFFTLVSILVLLIIISLIII